MATVITIITIITIFTIFTIVLIVFINVLLIVFTFFFYKIYIFVNNCYGYNQVLLDQDLLELPSMERPTGKGTS